MHSASCVILSFSLLLLNVWISASQREKIPRSEPFLLPYWREPENIMWCSSSWINHGKQLQGFTGTVLLYLPLLSWLHLHAYLHLVVAFSLSSLLSSSALSSCGCVQGDLSLPNVWLKSHWVCAFPLRCSEVWHSDPSWPGFSGILNTFF